MKLNDVRNAWETQSVDDVVSKRPRGGLPLAGVKAVRRLTVVLTLRHCFFLLSQEPEPEPKPEPEPEPKPGSSPVLVSFLDGYRSKDDVM